MLEAFAIFCAILFR